MPIVNYDRDYNDWVRGPGLRLGRRNHACGVIRSQDGSDDVVVVAGGSIYGNDITGTVEILRLNTPGHLVHLITQ